MQSTIFSKIGSPSIKWPNSSVGAVRTLRKDRQLGKGMPWARFGRTVYYRKGAPAALLAATEIKPVRDGGRAG